MKERVIAAVKKMKREQWIVCGLAGLLLLVIAMPVKKTEPEEVSVEETVQKDQEPDIRQEYEKQLELALSQVQGIGKVKVSVTMESTGKKIVEKDIPEDSEISSQKDGQGMESIRTRLPAHRRLLCMKKRKEGVRFPMWLLKSIRRSEAFWWWRRAEMIRHWYSRYRKRQWHYFMWKPIKLKY